MWITVNRYLVDKCRKQYKRFISMRYNRKCYRIRHVFLYGIVGVANWKKKYLICG